MTAVTVVSVEEKRAMLNGLGPKPNHEAVDQAKQALARIDAQLAEKVENSSLPADHADPATQKQEYEMREAAEKEKIAYKAVILLDELHQSYEVILEHEQARAAGLPKSNAGEDLSQDHAEAARRLQDAIENNRQTLDLTKCFISQVPECFGQIVSLVRLDLSNNRLKLLPNSISDLVNLESLKVRSNQLKTLPDSLGLMMKLKYLDVSSNAIRRLPESLGNCSSLLELNANFNQLEFISPNFGVMLLNLEKLELYLNALTSIPASLCDLKSLKHLDLHMNKLRGLPSSIGNLCQLEYLDVSSNFNDLQVVPESIGELISLTYLDLSFNQIKELPDSVGRLDKLTTFLLAGNPLVTPPTEVVEHSHDAVMEYMKQRWMTSIDGDQLISPGRLSFSSPRGKSEYNPWIPACAGNSFLAEWMDSWCGTVGPVLGGGTGTGNFLGVSLGFQQFQRNESFDQPL